MKVDGTVLQPGDVIDAERILADLAVKAKEMLSDMKPIAMTHSICVTVPLSLTYSVVTGIKRSDPINIITFHPIAQCDVYRKSPFRECFSETTYSTEQYINLLELALCTAVGTIPPLDEDDEGAYRLTAQDVFREQMRHTHFSVIDDPDKN